MESEIVIDGCNKHAQTSESTISYKNFNFVEHLDLVTRIKSKNIIVSTIGMKKLKCGAGLKMSLVKSFVPSSLLFVNFAIKWVISIFNAQAMIIAFLIQ
jgi:hypothetical protein